MSSGFSLKLKMDLIAVKHRTFACMWNELDYDKSLYLKMTFI